MSKKIMLLGLAAVSAAFALPAMATAEDIPVHRVPKPAAATPIAGGKAVASTVGGSFVECERVKGEETWESSTTGIVNLTAEGNCKGHIGNTTANCNSVVITGAPFHLVTVGGRAGILVTPPAGGVFAKFTCAFILTFEIKGNGIVATITSPACGGKSSTSTFAFEGAAGVQAHKKVDGTETEYHLTANGEEAAISGSGTVTFPAETTLECT